jgi:cytoskeleton protein RodZ
VVHLRKTMAIGETVGINGSLPLTVVIGRAQAIDVVVRGKPLDVQALARDNVARFQIQ